MTTIEIKTLKAAFLEYFRKIMPSVLDPKNEIRNHWTKLRDMLIDETKGPNEIYAYVKSIPYAPFIESPSEHQSAIKPVSANQLDQ